MLFLSQADDLYTFLGDFPLKLFVPPGHMLSTARSPGGKDKDDRRIALNILQCGQVKPINSSVLKRNRWKLGIHAQRVADNDIREADRRND